MKLKRVELQGFKSFVDRTVLEYDEGITAILGPNGCGKSNIVDAVRWVLGEQSAKQLRGDRMEDIIFKGTTKRKPIGMAEVSLSFNNSDRRLPIEFDEVVIRRRVTRDGISEYYLNGTLCRLKDIRDLLYDSGAGNTAYSIIEFAMINQVLNEHTQELRRLIEEGSGITKYKVRRRETQRKLDRTEHDLLRLNDIVEEIGREVRSLKYQVGKARRHQRLFREIRTLDLAVAGRSLQAMDRQEQESRESLSQLRAEAEANTGELTSLRSKIEDARPALDEREAERRQLEGALQAHEEQLQEVERQVLLLEHRIEDSRQRGQESQEALVAARTKQQDVNQNIAGLSERLQEVAEECEQAKLLLAQRNEDVALLEQRLAHDRGALEKATQLKLEFIESDAARQSQLRELQVKQENRRERIAELDLEKEQIAAREPQAAQTLAELSEARERQVDRRRDLLAELAATEREESDLQQKSTQIQEQVAKLTGRLEALKSRSELLRRIKDEYQGYGQGARQVLRNYAGDARVKGSLADRLQVNEDYTAAFEALFAELLDAVIVDGTDTAVSLVSELRQSKHGQTNFLSQNGPLPQPEAALPAPAQGRSARELVTGPGTTVPHVQHLLSRTWVFDSDDAARKAASAHSGTEPMLCLARSGLLVSSDGVVRGGGGKVEEVSLLGRTDKLEKLADEIVELERKLVDWQQQLDANRQRQQQLREALLRGRADLELLEEDLRQLHADSASLQSQRDADGNRKQQIEREQAALEDQCEDLAAAEIQLQGQMAESGRQRSDTTTRRETLVQVVEEAEQQRDQGRGQVEELRLQLEKLESERRETETALQHLRGTLADLAAAQERHQQEIELIERQRETYRTELAASKEKLEAGIGERQRRRQLVQASADAIQVLHAETEAWHDRIKEIEDLRAACREKMHAIETEMATLDVRRRNLQERVEEQYQGSFRELIRSYDPEHLPKALQQEEGIFQLDQAKELLVDLRGKLASLGPINQLALQEYEAKSERLSFLEKQRSDVIKAKEDLSTAIGRINRTARRLFLETFEEVRRNFIAVFQVLFEGGHADLKLIRTDDPLESQLRIVAQPRGKVVNHVGLLSGGERCLTALSLLFAVYLVKPSPFCMLDEVDAPLDDANIQRFVKMLQEFSRNTQFLVVTHNKLTMETANHLYGVTMMEQGVSSIVSVNFQDVADTQSDAELGAAIATRRRELDRRESVRAILADEDEAASKVRITLANGSAAEAPGGEDEKESSVRITLDDESESEAPDEEDSASMVGAGKPLREMEAEG